jgi:hypothetical protein
MKIEKDQSFPSSDIVNQIAKCLSSEISQSVILTFCQNQFRSFDYLFSPTPPKVNSSEAKKTIKQSINQGQTELSQKQISCLNNRQENYFLFLLLTLSRNSVSIDEINSYFGLNESISELVESKIAVVAGDLVTPTSTEFRFPISEIDEINKAYINFDKWDLEFSTQFDFETLVNKVMIRRISLRYLSVIKNHIDSVADLVRLSDESDKKFNNDVLHLQIKLSHGKIPG